MALSFRFEPPRSVAVPGFELRFDRDESNLQATSKEIKITLE
jgi:hypothetical protein